VSELKEWFLYKSVSDDLDTMAAVPRGGVYIGKITWRKKRVKG